MLILQIVPMDLLRPFKCLHWPLGGLRERLIGSIQFIIMLGTKGRKPAAKGTSAQVGENFSIVENIFSFSVKILLFIANMSGFLWLHRTYYFLSFLEDF